MTKIRLCLCVLLISVAAAEGVTDWACESKSFSVTCPGDGEIMVITKATYGISRSQTECGVTDQDATCSASRAKLLVNSRCSGKPSCEFQLFHHKISELNCPINDHNMMKVTYECIHKSNIIDICNTDVDDLPLTGYLSSPQYPYLYPTTSECTVTLPAQPGDESIIVVHDLLIETRDATACLDYLMIEDTQQQETHKYCETIYDSDSPVNFVSTLLGYQKIHFRSDSTFDSNSRGFLLRYTMKHKGPRLTSSTASPSGLATLSSSIFWKRHSSVIRPNGQAATGSTIPRSNSTPRSTPTYTPIGSTTTVLTQNKTESTEWMSSTLPATQPNISTYPTTLPTESTTVAFTPSQPKTNLTGQSSTTSMTSASTTPKQDTKYTATKTQPFSTLKIEASPSTTTEPPPIVAPGSSGNLSSEEMVGVIIVVLFVVTGIVLIFILVCCIKSRRKQKADKFAVSYNNGSSLLSFPSRESSSTSTSSTSPLDLCFSNQVYNYDFDANNGGTVVVDARHIHATDAVNDLPEELRKKAEKEANHEASVGSEADNAYAEIALQAGAMAMPANQDDPLESAEQGTQSADIFIMDRDAQDRKQRREDAKRDEPPNDCNYDLPITREESMRMNAVPEISLDHDVITMEEGMQNEENALREEQHLDTVPESKEDNITTGTDRPSQYTTEADVSNSHASEESNDLDVSQSTLNSDNTNNNASFSEETISLSSRNSESTDL